MICVSILDCSESGLTQTLISTLFLQASQASHTPASSSPLPQWEEVDQEEQQLRQKLRQKLDEMTGNISDQGLTSDEDEPNRPLSPRECASPAKPPSTPSSTLGNLVNTPMAKLVGPTESQSVQVYVCLSKSNHRSTQNKNETCIPVMECCPEQCSMSMWSNTLMYMDNMPEGLSQISILHICYTAHTGVYWLTKGFSYYFSGNSIQG